MEALVALTRLYANPEFGGKDAKLRILSQVTQQVSPLPAALQASSPPSLPPFASAVAVDLKTCVTAKSRALEAFRPSAGAVEAHLVSTLRSLNALPAAMAAVCDSQLVDTLVREYEWWAADDAVAAALTALARDVVSSQPVATAASLAAWGGFSHLCRQVASGAGVHALRLLDALMSSQTGFLPAITTALHTAQVPKMLAVSMRATVASHVAGGPTPLPPLKAAVLALEALMRVVRWCCHPEAMSDDADADVGGDTLAALDSRTYDAMFDLGRLLADGVLAGSCRLGVFRAAVSAVTQLAFVGSPVPHAAASPASVLAPTPPVASPPPPPPPVDSPPVPKRPHHLSRLVVTTVSSPDASDASPATPRSKNRAMLRGGSFRAILRSLTPRASSKAGSTLAATPPQPPRGGAGSTAHSPMVDPALGSVVNLPAFAVLDRVWDDLVGRRGPQPGDASAGVNEGALIKLLTAVLARLEVVYVGCSSNAGATQAQHTLTRVCHALPDLPPAVHPRVLRLFHRALVAGGDGWVPFQEAGVLVGLLQVALPPAIATRVLDTVTTVLRRRPDLRPCFCSVGWVDAASQLLAALVSRAAVGGLPAPVATPLQDLRPHPTLFTGSEPPLAPPARDLLLALCPDRKAAPLGAPLDDPRRSWMLWVSPGVERSVSPPETVPPSPSAAADRPPLPMVAFPALVTAVCVLVRDEPASLSVLGASGGVDAALALVQHAATRHGALVILAELMWSLTAGPPPSSPTSQAAAGEAVGVAAPALLPAAVRRLKPGASFKSTKSTQSRVSLPRFSDDELSSGSSSSPSAPSSPSSSSSDDDPWGDAPRAWVGFGAHARVGASTAAPPHPPAAPPDVSPGDPAASRAARIVETLARHLGASVLRVREGLCSRESPVTPHPAPAPGPADVTAALLCQEAVMQWFQALLYRLVAGGGHPQPDTLQGVVRRCGGITGAMSALLALADSAPVLDTMHVGVQVAASRVVVAALGMLTASLAANDVSYKWFTDRDGVLVVCQALRALVPLIGRAQAALGGAPSPSRRRPPPPAPAVVAAVLALAVGVPVAPPRARPTAAPWFTGVPGGGVRVRSGTLVAAALELVAHWEAVLPGDVVTGTLAWVADVSTAPTNQAALAAHGFVGCLLQTFARPPAGGAPPIASALWGEGAPHPAQPTLVALLTSTAGYSVSPSELFLWVRLLLPPRHTDAARPVGTLPAGAAGGGVPPLLDALTSVSMGSDPDFPGDAFGSAAVVRFDLSRHDGPGACAGIRLPSLAARVVGDDGAGLPAAESRSLWPPTAAYTIAVWLLVEAYETAVPAPPLHLLKVASVRGGKSVLELNLRGGLLTLTTGGKTVEFSAAYVETGQWCHVVVCAARGRLGPSTATLYINGCEMQGVKAPFVSSGPGSPHAYIGVAPPAADVAPDTDYTLAWRLGPFHLLADALSADAVCRLHAAGPAYGGVFHGVDGVGTVPAVREMLATWSASADDGALFAQSLSGGGVAAAAGAGDLGAPGGDGMSLATVSLASLPPSRVVATVVVRTPPDAASCAPAVDALCTTGAARRRRSAPPTAVVHACCGVGNLTALLEGAAEAFRPIRVAEALASVTNDGLSVAFGLVSGATTTECLAAALRLLACWLQTPAAPAAMHRLRGYHIVSHLLCQQAAAGNLDAACMRILLGMTGLRDPGVVPHASARDRMGSLDSGTSDPTGSLNSRSGSGLAALAAGVSFASGERATMGRGAGQLLLDGLALRHFVLQADVWLQASDAAQAAMLTALVNAVVATRRPQRAFNRAQLRSLNIVRHLLRATLDDRLTTRRLGDVIHVLQSVLLDDTPSVGQFAAVADFLAATLSPQLLAAVSRRPEGSRQVTPASPRGGGLPASPASPAPTSPEDGFGDRYRSVSDLSAIDSLDSDHASSSDSDRGGGGGGGGSRLRAAAPPHRRGSSTGSRRRAGGGEAAAPPLLPAVVSTRNRLLAMVAKIVTVVCRDAAEGAHYRDALLRTLSLRWLSHFLHWRNHPSTVLAALRVMACALPLFRSMAHKAKFVAGLRSLGRRLRALHWLAEGGPTVTHGTTQLYILLAMLLGTPVATLPAAGPAVFDKEHLSMDLRTDADIAFPEFVHVILRLLARGFQHVPGRRVRRGRSRRHVDAASPSGGGGRGGGREGGALPAGSAAIVTTLQFLWDVHQHSPAMAALFADDRHRGGLLVEVAAVVFAAGEAAAAAESPPSTAPPPAGYPFHTPPARAAVEFLASLLVAWLVDGAKHGLAALDTVLAMSPAAGKAPAHEAAYGRPAPATPVDTRPPEAKAALGVGFQAVLLARVVAKIRARVPPDALDARSAGVLGRLAGVVAARVHHWEWFWQYEAPSDAATPGAAAVSLTSPRSEAGSEVSAAVTGAGRASWGAVGAAAVSTVHRWATGLLRDLPATIKGGGSVLQSLGFRRGRDRDGLQDALAGLLRASTLHRLECARTLGSRAAVDAVLRDLLADRDVVLAPVPGRAASEDAGFVKCLAYQLAFLLEDDAAETRDAAMGLFRELLQRRQATLVHELAVDTADGDTLDLFKDGFELLVGGGGGGKAGLSPFVAFQLWMSGLAPEVRDSLLSGLEDHWVQRHVAVFTTACMAWDRERGRWTDSERRAARADRKRGHAASKAAAASLEWLKGRQAHELQWQASLAQQDTDIARHGNTRWQSMARLLRAEGGVWGPARPGMAMVGGPGELFPPRPPGDWGVDPLEGPARQRKKLLRRRHRLVVPPRGSAFTPAATVSPPAPASPPPPATVAAVASDLAAQVVAAALAHVDAVVTPPRRPPRVHSRGDSDGESSSATEGGVGVATTPPSSDDDGGEGGGGGGGGSDGDADSSSSTTTYSDEDGEGGAGGGASSSEGEEEGTGLAADDDCVAEVDFKLRPLLEPADGIHHIYDCSRVHTMDVVHGVLILSDTAVYIVDNFRLAGEGEDGEGRGVPSPTARRRSTRVVEIVGGGGDGALGALGGHHEPVSPVRGAAPPPQPPAPRLQPPPRSRVATFVAGELEWGGAPQDAVSPAASRTPGSGAQPSPATHNVRRWPYTDVFTIHKRRYLLRHTALEVFSVNGRTHLVVLTSPSERDEVYARLVKLCPAVREAPELVTGGIEFFRRVDPGAGSSSAPSKLTPFSRDVYTSVQKALLKQTTARWEDGTLSNFEYLMSLNTLAGRSYNDLIQYPVFPWVLADYTSPDLDLDNPDVYRDLSKPMGALYREAEFRDRYDALMDMPSQLPGGVCLDGPGGGCGAPPDDGACPPYHYGTHYASSTVVLYYLLRLQPFASAHVQLQNGRFDNPNRLFASVGEAWASACGLSHTTQTQDVKELVPEFYYLPDFLENRNGYPLGTREDGQDVGDVALPPWAHGSPQEFIRLHRRALESEHVSRHLHLWVDLVFGCKQRGAAAVEAVNVFHPLTYEGAVNIDNIEDAGKREAIMSVIQEFGQTPSQLFDKPHPPRRRMYPGGALLVSSSGLLGSPLRLGRSPSGAGGGRPLSLPAALRPPSPRKASSVSMLPPARLTAASATIHRSASGPAASKAPQALSPSKAPQPPSPVSPRPRAQAPSADVGSGPPSPVATPVPAVESPMVLMPDAAPLVTAPAALAPFLVRATEDVPSLAAGSMAALAGVRLAHLQQVDVMGALESCYPGDRVLMLPLGSMLLGPPPRTADRAGVAAAHYLAWGFTDASFRVFRVGEPEGGLGSSSLAHTFEGVHASPVTCAHMTSNGGTLILGGSDDCLLTVWTVGHAKGAACPWTFTLRASLCGHLAAVTHVAASHSYAVIVSGSVDGTVILWDASKSRYVATLLGRPLPYAVSHLSVSDKSGNVLVAAGPLLLLCDVNGKALAGVHAATPVMCADVGEVPEWMDGTVVVTGHMDGMVKVWGLQRLAAPAARPPFAAPPALETSASAADEVLASIQHQFCYSLVLRAVLGWHKAAITAMRVSPDHKLFTADAAGNAIEWCLDEEA